MKKIAMMTVFVLIFVSIGVSPSFALPLYEDGILENGVFKIDEYIFTVHNKSDDTDTYNATYFGYTGDDYTGFYLGTIEGNTDNAQNFPFITIVEYYYKELTGSELIVNLDEYYKVDNVGDGNLISEDGLLKITFKPNNELGYMTGTWDFLSSSKLVSFYAIKGATEFSLYYVDPQVNDGNWTTRHLLMTKKNGQLVYPEISHFSILDPPLATPEPSTVVLLGFGFLALGVAARRRFK